MAERHRGRPNVDLLKGHNQKKLVSLTHPKFPCLEQSSWVHPPPTQHIFNKMPRYNTRSVARQRAAAGHFSDSEQVPALSTASTSPHRPMTPDQDEDEIEEFQRSPTACSVDLPDEPTPSTVNDESHSAADRTLVERMHLDLQERKIAAEAHLQHHRNLLSNLKSNRPANPRADEEAHLPFGPKFPPGVIGFAREGTWVSDENDILRPESKPSTTQLPSIRGIGEVPHEVQDPPLNTVAQVHLSRGRGGVFRELTPLPSFVTR